MTATSYDRVVYPTGVFAQTHPDRLAVAAKLFGLDPVDPAKSRILEIGGGNSMNLISIASAWPECEAHGFDLSESAIAMGQQYVDAAELSNVHLAVDDIREAHKRYPAKSFDYVIAHGVYAWVEPDVARALMELVGHVLSDRGAAIISYNCFPGGHARMIMREMIEAETEGIDDLQQRLGAMRRFLEQYAPDQPNDTPLVRVLREHARFMLGRTDGSIYHDELNEVFLPQYLAHVVAEAKDCGLRYLTDAARGCLLEGFVRDDQVRSDDPDSQVLRAAVRNDYRTLRYFRQTIFVRSEQVPDRRSDVNRASGLHLSTPLKRQEDGSFLLGSEKVDIYSPELASAIESAAANSPQRTPVSEIAKTPEHLRTVLRMHSDWYVNLHNAPAPFAAEPGEYPETCPLGRAMLRMGDSSIATLNHLLLRLDRPEMRALLRAADGTKTVSELAELGHGIPPDKIAEALGLAAKDALLVR